MSTFEKIAAILETKGLRQADLARMTGISPSRLTQLGQDNGKLRVFELLRISRALGVSMEYLADPDLVKPEPRLSPDESVVLQMIRRLGVDEAERRLLLTGPALVIEPQSRGEVSGQR